MKLIVLGAGSRGDVYARYATESGVEIAGVAEPNEERRQVFCKSTMFLKKSSLLPGRRP